MEWNADWPSLVITRRLENGTPMRGVCSLCEVELSTEAFDSDDTFPHAEKLNEWYREHFLQVHISR